MDQVLTKDSEVFEITDFTTASDWERFICDFEEILREWNLTSKKGASDRKQTVRPKSVPDSGGWSQEFETLRYAKIHFTATHHFLRAEDGHHQEKITKKRTASKSDLPPAFEEMVATDNDFPYSTHCIARWYGVREFIIISPAGNTDAITSEDKAKLLLSSASIALTNTQCSVPVFVQLHHSSRKFFQGVCTGHDVRCYFDMVHFLKAPGNYMYLSEILNLYKEKLSCSLAECPPVNVTIRLTHVLKEWPTEWQFIQDIEEDILEPSVEVSTALKFVCFQDPIQELHLATTWPSLSEEVVADSPFHSDLNALQAPKWMVRLNFKSLLSTSLSDSLGCFFNLTCSWAGSRQILGKMIEDIEEKEADYEVRQALDKMANPMTLSMPQIRANLKWNQSQSVKSALLGFIFESEPQKVEPTHDKKSGDEAPFTDFRAFKSSPYKGLGWRMAHVLCQANYLYKDLAAIAYLWREIVSELRRFWEKCSLIPGLDGDGSPNQSSCLLNQKLQMLNSCIRQKISREQKGKDAPKGERREGSHSEDEDEFFDCVDDSVQVFEGEGRLSVFNNQRLVGNNELLYIPITQEPMPMTEDMLQEQAQIFAQLGTSSEGANLRARMQSAGLLSDMEAFKAANPGAVLDDFVRWYSPRDYVEDEVTDEKGNVSKKGQLSDRMKLPGNIWAEVWDSAKAIPAHKQKRLFDYTKEAEKVLHYLTSFTLHDLVDHLMPILIHSAAAQLVQERNNLKLNQSEFPVNLNHLLKYNNCCDFATGLGLVRDIESHLFEIHSVAEKLEMAHRLEFPEKPYFWDTVKSFVISLVNEPEVEVSGAGYHYFGQLVKRIFHETTTDMYQEQTSVGERTLADTINSPTLPPPIYKEFILRVNVPRPAVYSKPLPQRMYCVLGPNEFRLSGAFSEDTLYC